MDNLYHYSRLSIPHLTRYELVFSDTYDESRECSKYYLRPFMKPEGLWFSPEDATAENDCSWRDYCLEELDDDSLLGYKYHVELGSCANLLILDTVSSMYEFNKRYLVYYDEPVLRSLAICWQKVALDYQGILIAPYHWSLRLDADFRWYYPWDCASGCIWDISAIESFTLLQGG